VNPRWIAILIAVCALLACKRPAHETSETNRDAIKALGSTVPATQFDREFWQREHDANSPQWREAKRLCGQTVLASYPNCLPVNDIIETDQRKKANAGNKAAAKIEEMGRRGYVYDYVRKTWLPTIGMESAGCAAIPAFPNDHTRLGSYTWKCLSSVSIPKGIPDEQFGEEER
jgi:hypothetical protein